MKIQEILYNELSNEESVKEQLIQIIEKNYTTMVKKQRVISKEVEQPDDEEDAVADDTPITAQMVLEYLESRGMQKTPVNYECAKKFLMENKRVPKQKKVEYIQEVEEYEEEQLVTEKEFVNHLDAFTEDDMKTMLDICLLRKLNALTGPFEYVTSVIDASDAAAIGKEITKYADQGYRVNNMTNQDGKNMLILFERPKKIEKLDFSQMQ